MVNLSVSWCVLFSGRPTLFIIVPNGLKIILMLFIFYWIQFFLSCLNYVSFPFYFKWNDFFSYWKVIWNHSKLAFIIMNLIKNENDVIEIPINVKRLDNENKATKKWKEVSTGNVIKSWFRFHYKEKRIVNVMKSSFLFIGKL